MKQSGIAPWIKVQDTVNIRGVAKSTKLKFQSGKLIYIFYFELQYFAVRKMIEQGLDFWKINGIR